MQTITIKGREYSIEATGLKHIAYKIRADNHELTGIRNVPNPDLILVVDKQNRRVASFLESTMQRVEIIG